MALSDRIVVMHDGKILQIGTPEDIYRRPVCREVAAFFGSPNFLEARALGSAPEPDGTYRVRVRGEGWEGICRTAEAFTADTAVLVMIRPEDARIGPLDSAAGKQIVWRGKVIDTIFRGPRRSIGIDVGGRRFQCRGAFAADRQSGTACGRCGARRSGLGLRVEP